MLLSIRKLVAGKYKFIPVTEDDPLPVAVVNGSGSVGISNGATETYNVFYI